MRLVALTDGKALPAIVPRRTVLGWRRGPSTVRFAQRTVLGWRRGSSAVRFPQRTVLGWRRGSSAVRFAQRWRRGSSTSGTPPGTPAYRRKERPPRSTRATPCQTSPNPEVLRRGQPAQTMRPHSARVNSLSLVLLSMLRRGQSARAAGPLSARVNPPSPVLASVLRRGQPARQDL
jgi:hypothetical protein